MIIRSFRSILAIALLAPAIAHAQSPDAGVDAPPLDAAVFEPPRAKGMSTSIEAQPIKALHYGDTLFNFFQDKHFSAITGLMTSQHFDRLAPHGDEAEVLLDDVLEGPQRGEEEEEQHDVAVAREALDDRARAEPVRRLLRARSRGARARRSRQGGRRLPSRRGAESRMAR